MKKLSAKEKEIMKLFWSHGPMFIREMLNYFDDPKPHYNTVSTFIKLLIEKDYVTYKAYGNTYLYRAKISEEEYMENMLGELINEFYENSYTEVVSNFIKRDKIKLKELKELIAKIESEQ